MEAPDAVAVVDEVSPVVMRVRAMLAEAGIDAERYRPGSASQARVLVVGGKSTLPVGFVAATPRLRVVIRTGAGYDNVPLAELTARGVELIAPRLAGDGSVAEFVLGAAVALLRDFRGADHAVRAGHFSFRNRAHGRELAASTLGIIGMGRIGRRVAELGLAFGMRPIAWNPWSDRAFPPGVRRARELVELLGESDVVTVHCQLNEETHNLLDGAALAAMRRGAVLVNTGRGGLVDEHALATALLDGHLSGAAIDTFATEPDIAASPLVTVHNALLSPHLAGVTDQSVQSLSEFVSTTVIRYLETGATPHAHRV